MTEALNFHIAEATKLKKDKKRLEEENQKLLGDKELNEMMVQEKVAQTKKQKQELKSVSMNYKKELRIRIV